MNHLLMNLEQLELVAVLSILRALSVHWRCKKQEGCLWDQTRTSSRRKKAERSILLCFFLTNFDDISRKIAELAFFTLN
ncbi:hypothetical protein OPV22_027560 [Ensete ventricosum]|uniref:Secreted protein n=1 Tax=Ensete ventricosum TaxID=4639 RepID=A0AAV8PVQ0_ENSVE|nr:hypothetical protein OPV22_027560 [Ensete ventricosum]